jgi:hypothetical protein
MNEAKRNAIAQINEKLGPGGWYSEDFKAGFDLAWEAAMGLSVGIVEATMETLGPNEEGWPHTTLEGVVEQLRESAGSE